MRWLGILDAALVGILILTLGIVSGWNLKHEPSWGQGFSKPMWVWKHKPPPEDFCVVKGAVVSCRPAPPRWRH